MTSHCELLGLCTKPLKGFLSLQTTAIPEPTRGPQFAFHCRCWILQSKCQGLQSDRWTLLGKSCLYCLSETSAAIGALHSIHDQHVYGADFDLHDHTVSWKFTQDYLM